MRRRLSLVFLPLLYAPISFANEAAWDCKQNKDTKEWLCVGDEKPTTQTDESGSLPAIKSQPVLTEPVDTPYTQPVTPTTAQRPKPVEKPVVDEDIEPVISRTKPVEKPLVVPITPTTAQRTKPVEAPAINEDVEPVTPTTAQQRTKPVDTPVTDEASQELSAEKDTRSQSAESSAITLPPTPERAKPSSTTAKHSGWNCDSNDEDENWNCQLVGTDPKGQAHPVKVAARETSSGLSLLDPAFDTQQEQNFDTLTSKLKYDPWENCAVPQKQAKPPVVAGKNLRDTSPLELTSNFAEIFDNEIGSYLGNVEINRADQHSLSHIANYDKVSETLDLNGDVYYNEDELALYGRSASIKLASDQSKLRDALFISPATHLRGRSKVVYRDSKTFSRYKDVAYTSCRPGNQDWVLHASELKLNDVSGKGAVKNAWIEFKGVPVFYTPYLSFPTDDRRSTGFLPASLHYTQQGGVGIYTPYYWNIAPNYDATFTPRYLTSRGLLLDGNFRYLEEMTKGYVKLEYLANDKQLNKSRYLGAMTNHTVYTPHISSNLDLNYVSDKNYFNQLGNALAIPNFAYLRSSADVNYIREGVSLTARADNYQRVDPNLLVLPYRRLPQVNLNLNHSFKSVPMDVTMENESVYFQHGTFVNGERLNTKPSVSFPLQTASAFVTPKLSFQYTQYILNKNTISSNNNSNNNISRALPIFSLDSGAFFEKDLKLGNSSMLHTLEPRLFYLYIPRKDQSNIPLFDTAQYDFVFNSLFRENRFSGTDRIQDANQLSVALTSRLVDSRTGQEKLKLNLGNIFYFKDRNVTLNSIYGAVPYSIVETSWSSPIIAEVSSQLTDHISVESGTQWDPHTNTITRGKAGIHFINQPNEIVNASFLYRRNPLVHNAYPLNDTLAKQDDIVQSDLSAHWPIYNDWSVVGRWQYSWLYNRTQESFLGVEKENCCWRFRVIGRHYMSSLVNISGVLSPGSNAVPQGQAQTGIFFQIELKGLAGIGERLETFFEKNIYGYRKPEQ